MHKQTTISYLASGVLIGAAVASFLPIELAVGLVPLAVALKKPWMAVGILAISLRFMSSPLDPAADDVALLAGQAVQADGVVLTVLSREDARVKFVADLTAQGYRGKTLVTSRSAGTLGPGDQVRLRGKLERPARFGTFDYRAYLAKDGIHSVMRSAQIRSVDHRRTLAGVLFAGREFFTDRVKRHFAGDTGSFLLGIMVGETSGMSARLEENFQRTGLTHVLALSGYNISILLGVILALTGRSRTAIVTSLVCLALFVMFVGPSASVVRAALMGGFLLLGQGLGRPQLAIRACFITAAAMLMMAPWSLRYDIGFDLSFLATLGILRFEPAIRRYFGFMPVIIKEISSATVAATLLTLPLIAYSFGMMSAVSPMANVMTIPAIPWLMFGGFATFCLGIIMPPAGQWLAAAVSEAAGLLLGAIDYLAHLPHAAVVFQPHDGKLTLWTLAVCGGLSGWLYYQPGPDYRSYSRGKSEEPSANG